jgi:curved DNA-binding protein CbpA
MTINRKLLDILLDLHGKSRSGILRIQKDAAKKQLVLRNGLLVLAESNLPQEHLAWTMVTLKLLPRPQLNEIAVSMKAGKTSEDAILSLSGTGMEDLDKGRREQALAIVASMLVWDDCEACFYPGEDLIPHRVTLGMPLPELILSSVRHAIAKRLVSAPSHFLENTFRIAEDCAKSGFPLNQAESYICSLLRIPGKAADLLPAAHTAVSKPEQALLCLYLLGLIVCQSDQTAGVIREASLEREADPVTQKLEELLIRFQSANLYEILSVGTDASQEDIQEAYHEQAKQLHPDRFQTAEFSSDIRGKAEQVFARINEAYFTLKNPASRASYEKQRAQQKVSAAGPKPGAAQAAETAEALFREGKSLLFQGDLETAVERLKGCVWLCPDKAAYNHYLGVAESQIPKLRKSAEQHLLKALELEDVSVDSHLALAKLYIDVKLPRKAEFHLQQVLRWNPQNAAARDLLSGLKKTRHTPS